jgi:hypothetical protein
MKTSITMTEFDECLTQFLVAYAESDDGHNGSADRTDATVGLKSVLDYLGVDVETDRTEVWVLMHDAISTDGFTWVEVGMVTTDEMIAEFEKEVSGWGTVVPIEVRLVRMWVPELRHSHITGWLDKNTEAVEKSLTVRLHTSPNYAETKATWSKS